MFSTCHLYCSSCRWIALARSSCALKCLEFACFALCSGSSRIPSSTYRGGSSTGSLGSKGAIVAPIINTRQSSLTELLHSAETHTYAGNHRGSTLTWRIASSVSDWSSSKANHSIFVTFPNSSVFAPPERFGCWRAEVATSSYADHENSRCYDWIYWWHWSAFDPQPQATVW